MQLGPLGWLWRVIYERVFNSDPVMMAMLGWALYLSPVILVLSARAVLKGAVGSMRRPPEALVKAGEQ